MSRRIIGIRVVCASLAACLLTGGPAYAQDRDRGGNPFSGLFRGSPKDQPHSLDLRAAGFVAWDDNPINQAPNGPSDQFTIDPRFLKEGVAGGMMGSVVYGYHKTGNRSAFNLGANAALQQFASGAGTGMFVFQSYGGNAGLTSKLSGRTSMSFGAGAGYAPYYEYAPFLRNTLTEESPVGADYGYAVSSVWVRSETVSGGLTHSLTKRTTITSGVALEKRQIPDHDDANIDQRTASVTINHMLTRKLGFHVGYSLQESRYAFLVDGEPLRTHGMDVGLNYGDGLTFQLGRHTTVSFNVGVAAAKAGDPRIIATTGKQTAIVVNGRATLSRSLGRSWGASLGYLRDTSYQVGVTEPMINDSANVGIGGPLAPRLNFSAGAGAGRGQRLFSEGHNDVISYGASARLAYAILRNLGVYAQTSYYRFTIPPDFTTFGFVPKLDRRTVSVGINTWIPLIKPPRTRRDPGAQQPTGLP